MSPEPMGELDPAVAAQVEAFELRHRGAAAELAHAVGPFRHEVIARAVTRMRAAGWTEAQVEAAVDDGLSWPARFWVGVLRGDLGPWDD